MDKQASTSNSKAMNYIVISVPNPIFQIF
jgi:hypothetical protein